TVFSEATMKHTTILSVLFTALAISGCSTAGGTRDEYFGYNNKARDKEEQQKQQNEPSALAQQPVQEPNPADDAQTDGEESAETGFAMADNRTNPFAIQNTGDIYIENYYADDRDVEYVPVVVPWWERYYDPYVYHYHHYRPHVVITW